MSQPATEHEVCHWWSLWPEANVGVVTGSVSGVVTIDVDPRHGGEETLWRMDGLPPTLESETGGGGRHLWYARPDRELPSVELGMGVELKAERGLIVAPPSRHASGEPYRWLDYSRMLAPLPEWVSQLVEAPSSRRQDRRQPFPIRTAQERAEFREAWTKAGIELTDGEAHCAPFTTTIIRHSTSMPTAAVGIALPVELAEAPAVSSASSAYRADRPLAVE